MIILKAMIVMALLGTGFAIILTIVGRIFAIKENPRKDLLLKALPGMNCGACGFPGCSGFADALFENKADIGKCKTLTADKKNQLAAILGKEILKEERVVAVIACRGTKENSATKYIYSGIKDCRAVQLIAGGNKVCSFGCLGFNTCVNVCPFGAIKPSLEMNPPIIDPDRCVGCGLCVDACPRGVIKILPVFLSKERKLQQVAVLCNSKDRGALIHKYCKVGCIACKLCVKVCSEEAISIIDNLAVIDYKKCTNCGLCIEECPTGIINLLNCGQTH